MEFGVLKTNECVFPDLEASLVIYCEVQYSLLEWSSGNLGAIFNVFLFPSPLDFLLLFSSFLLLLIWLMILSLSP